ncbi:DUF4231 domain-containing protein [Actinomycetospora aeridis]|uniref:DUF4231 domain-containing protein n=1 Tax=Actinomycetospora aeridis TaxID=3129231 RepID=A0ABU8MYE1_9PSEU
MTRPALFQRFPSLRAPTESYPVLPDDAAARFPALGDEIATLERIVGPEFARSDLEALRQQHRYRALQIGLILGATALAALGGLQAALADQRWPGIALTLLGLVLATVGQMAGELQTFQRFLEERIKAERFRAMYFRYLSRTGRYAGQDHEIVLRRAVLAVKAGEEPQ